MLVICTLGVRDSVVLNLSPRGTRKEIVLTSNLEINFVRSNLPQGCNDKVVVNKNVFGD